MSEVITVFTFVIIAAFNLQHYL